MKIHNESLFNAIILKRLFIVLSITSCAKISCAQDVLNSTSPWIIEKVQISTFSSSNEKYTLIRKEETLRHKEYVRRKSVRDTNTLKDDNGKILWEGKLPGTVDFVRTNESGEPIISVRPYSCKRSIFFDHRGQLVRSGENYPKYLRFKEDFNDRYGGIENPLQVIDSKADKVIREITCDDVFPDAISEDGQFFVRLKFLVPPMPQMTEPTPEEIENIKRGEISEEQFTYEAAAGTPYERVLTLYDVMGNVLWEKKLSPTSYSMSYIKGATGKLQILVSEVAEGGDIWIVYDEKGNKIGTQAKD